MAQSKLTSKKRQRAAWFTSTATLALWRLRRMWGMLFITGLGTIAAVMLVCAVPLYAQVALTTGLRDVLRAAPDSATLAVDTSVVAVSPNSVAVIKDSLNQLADEAGLQGYLDEPPQIVIQTHNLPVLKPKLSNPLDTLAIRGDTIKEVAKHIKIVQGHLPNSNSKTLEVMLTPETAQGFHVTINSTLIVPFNLMVGQGNSRLPPANEVLSLPLHIVGLYTTNNTNDTFWHGSDVNLVASPGMPPTLYGTAIVASDAFIATLNTLAYQEDAAYSSDLTDISCYYHINTSHLSINHLNDLIANLAVWQESINETYPSQYVVPDFPYVNSVNLQGNAFSTTDNQSTLELYRDRIGVLQIPNVLVLFQILALVLFFVGMMAELLVERQTETIAILRSRGANRWQIFGSFMTQSIGLGVVALLVGPLLALFAATLVAQHTLAPQEQGSLNILWHDPVGVLYGLRSYALAAVLLAVATMAFSIYRTVSMDVLAIRRESARTTVRPLWQRLNLDILAAVIAITGYCVSLYVSGIRELDVRANALIVSPLALVAPLFLVVAGILLVLRLFPLLLRLGAFFATRGRGASAMLALGQMARAPRQSLRLTLLLALASAFTIFTLVFIASQEQRAYDIAAYQVGADFSGLIAYDTGESIQNQTEDFIKQTHGVVAATFGYASTVTTAGSSGGYPFEVRGVDADTFAHTAIWTQANSTQSLDTLMHQLRVRRSDVAKTHVLPALVDAAMWQQLKLSVDERFVLHDNNTDGTQIAAITYLALAEVEHIPTIQSSGLLFDYQSGNTLYQALAGGPMPRNYLWVKSSDDSAALASVRHALTTVQPLITELADRRATIQALRTDPLYLDLVGVLALGAITALLLALVGNLLASWLSARNRVTNFAVLRALGTSEGQVAGILTWEQGITYSTSLVVGIVFGAVLSATAIPSLVFSSVPTRGLNSESSSAQFYVLQHVIPIQITIPVSLVVALVLLVSICTVALWMMVRVVTQPALGQMLRLNED